MRLWLGKKQKLEKKNTTRKMKKINNNEDKVLIEKLIMFEKDV